MLLKRKIKVISARKKPISKMESFRSYIGRSVISKAGDKIGKVFDLRFSGNNVEGLIVSKRFSRFFIDKSFISGVSDKAIMLSINPVVLLIGKHVFDADGKKLGKVVDVVRKDETNSMEALMVRKNFYSRQVRVPKNDIEVSKKNVILKKVY